MLRCYYQLEKLGGKKPWRGRKYVSKSFVKGFIWALSSNMASDGSRSTLNINGISSTVSNGGYLYCNGVGGTLVNTTTDDGSSFTAGRIGIVVGTGTDSVLVTNHQLQSECLAGVSAGRLEHGGHFFPKDVSVSGSNATFRMERIFRNSSGNAIVIGEVGIYGYHTSSTALNFLNANTPIFCFVRDKLAATVNVADGEYLKVSYTIQVTV